MSQLTLASTKPIYVYDSGISFSINKNVESLFFISFKLYPLLLKVHSGFLEYDKAPTTP